MANFLVSLARRGAGSAPAAGTAAAMAPRRVLTWAPAVPKIQPVTAKTRPERLAMAHPQRPITQLPRESERAGSDPHRVAPPPVYSEAENKPAASKTQWPRESERTASDPLRVGPPPIYSNAENRMGASIPEAASRGPDWTPQPITPASARELVSQAAERTTDRRPVLAAQSAAEPLRAATVSQEKRNANNESRAGRQTSEVQVVHEREEVRHVSVIAPEPPGPHPQRSTRDRDDKSDLPEQAAVRVLMPRSEITARDLPSASEGPVVRPVPEPRLPDPRPESRSEQRVTVHIGTIEIRATEQRSNFEAQSMPTASPVPASAGFDAFSHLRSYEPWSR